MRHFAHRSHVGDFVRMDLTTESSFFRGKLFRSSTSGAESRSTCTQSAQTSSISHMLKKSNCSRAPGVTLTIVCSITARQFALYVVELALGSIHASSPEDVKVSLVRFYRRNQPPRGHLLHRTRSSRTEDR